ncbi:MAG: hypothetical protein ACTSWQ_00820 [Candidatus Thorarchaeota archaeon]
MAIGTDFTITSGGDIRHSANTNHYTVLELHRWLQDLADDDEATYSTSDIVDITSQTPSERSTDQIITLLNGYNIDDDAAEYFYGGSITQDDGDTVYSGLQVLGAVNSSATQIQIIQDHALYDGDSPFWGTQASPYNGGGSTLMRVLIKSRVNGCDIDQKQIRVRTAHWGDAYDFFNVTLGEGEAVAAVSSVDDPQNDTLQATVQAWSGGDIPTNTEGWQLIDIGDGNGDQPYYSQWTFNTNTDGMKAIWEWGKDITGTGTSSTIHSMDGELFLGPTHSFVFDNQSGTFTEDEIVCWGTDIVYDALAGGTFTEGNYVTIGTAGAAGKIVYDSGTTACRIALEDTAITILDDDVITEYSVSTGATGVTAAVNASITNNDKEGGEGILLGFDDTSDNLFIQVVHGQPPVDNLPIRGITSAATCDVAGSVTTRTVPKVFLGSYVGTLIGAYGIGIDSDDLTSSDTVTDLDGDVNTPPNNVTFTVYGVVNGEDRVLVGEKDTGDDFKWDQMTLNTTLNSSGQTIVDVGTGNIPANTPSSGTLRVTLDDGRIRYIAYTSQDGDDEFTTASTDWTDPDDATSGNSVMISYIDKVADGTDVSYTTIYTTPQTLWVRVRDGGGTPIKTYEAQSTLSASGGNATASRITDA